MSERTFVVGDIHGCVDEMQVLLQALPLARDSRLIFLGDYVDRGPAPKGVIDLLLQLQGEGMQCVFLKGNHEDMFLDFMGLGGRYGRAFLDNGGDATLASYGLDGCAGPEVALHLPPAHRAFLLNLQLYYRAGDFLCVHAGIDPLRPLADQDEEDLLWIREKFIWESHDLGLTILFGHTPQREVLADLPYKLGLDTGLVYRNKLSCFEVNTKEILQVRYGAREVKRWSLAEEFAAAARKGKSGG